MKRALVLAGGGVAGIAWELGVLLGLQDADPGLAAEVIGADMVIGTSAGSAVAAQVTSGVALDGLYAAQLSDETAEIEVDVDVTELFARFTAAVANATTPTDMRRAVGALALATPTVPEATRLTAVAARLPVSTWPERTMLLPAVDAETGEYVAFTRDSGVALVDAVAASCAVPGVWPPVTIAGRRYIDGGIRSGTNADLAAGCDRILVVLPTLPDQPSPFGRLSDEIELLKPGRVFAVYADEASLAAFGLNALSPATRPASARAGRAIGRTAATAIAAFWS